MNKIIILLLLISPSLNAQISFWDKDDIIEKQFQPKRKAMKIKTAYNYIVGSKWKVDDSTRYNEIKDYNENGQIIVNKKYKTDWVNNRRYFQTIDSTWYTDKGIFKELRRYTPVGNNGYQFSYKAVATHNNKGNIKRLDTYTGYMASEPKSYDEYEYDKNDKVSKITVYNTKTKEKKYQRLFIYDKDGNLTVYTSLTFFGGFEGKTVYKMEYSKGKLASYQHWYNGKEKQNEALYYYDGFGRYVKRKYTTNTSYEDVFECYYIGDGTIPTGTQLKYSSGKGKKKSTRQNNLVYKFEYFE